ncbi:hypothetical protein J2S59_001180 [Nocardioides massiliensis]|uniref:Uncharacterized protein n=1 Tax=Nocardioides massiliensis TaxID=1325935 RepID=A0ABT9NM12_9ACTN|nr:hypothetical protein [Nocardioides massiliensis]
MPGEALAERGLVLVVECRTRRQPRPAYRDHNRDFPCQPPVSIHPSLRSGHSTNLHGARRHGDGRVPDEAPAETGVSRPQPRSSLSTTRLDTPLTPFGALDEPGRPRRVRAAMSVVECRTRRQPRPAYRDHNRDFPCQPPVSIHPSLRSGHSTNQDGRGGCVPRCRWSSAGRGASRDRRIETTTGTFPVNHPSRYTPHFVRGTRRTRTAEEGACRDVGGRVPDEALAETGVSRPRPHRCGTFAVNCGRLVVSIHRSLRSRHSTNPVTGVSRPG